MDLRSFTEISQNSCPEVCAKGVQCSLASHRPAMQLGDAALRLLCGQHLHKTHLRNCMKHLMSALAPLHLKFLCCHSCQVAKECVQD